ncbi:MAG: polysaccharide deacetylase family protein [Nitrospirae bacterium]|nr:MAG: polysaccharide deacetylase family protein [Nitrospirota bacterium]
MPPFPGDVGRAGAAVALALHLRRLAGGRPALSILLFHRVLEAPDPLLPEEPVAEGFERQMRLVRAALRPLPLGEAVHLLRADRLPADAVAITFDDGYENNHRLARPILERLGVPATFFVAAGFLEGQNMWNDEVIEAVRRAPEGELDLEPLGLGRWSMTGVAERRRLIDTLLAAWKYLPPEERSERVAALSALVGGRSPSLMMRPEAVAELAASGFEVGGHTLSHPILARLGEAEAAREIEAGKQRLEEIIGRRITLFAYPNGKPGTDYTARDVALVGRAGFEAAVSTAKGVARRGSDLYQLPRFTPWDRSAGRFAVRLLANHVGGRP